MESKEIQKQSKTKNETEIRQESQNKELQFKEKQLNTRLSKLQATLAKFSHIFKANEGQWQDLKQNKPLQKLILDVGAMKDLKKGILGNEGKLEENKRRVSRAKEELKNLAEERRKVEDKIERRKLKIRKQVDFSELQSRILD